MPVPIAAATDVWRYHRIQDGGRELGDVSASDALRAFADDLLESGDPRLALERAFRWGYRNERGEHVPGLQEHIQDLRFRRDRLLRQVEHEAYLDSLSPELDRIDAIERDAWGESPLENDTAESAAERLAARLDGGYRSAGAQSELDRLLDELRQSTGRERTESTDSPPADPRGAGQSATGFGAMRSTRAARLDQLRHMLFHGGVQAESTSGPSGWRRVAGVGVPPQVMLDLHILSELDEVEATLARLEGLGSVVSLADLDLVQSSYDGSDGVFDWLSGWQRAVSPLLVAGGGGSTTRRLAIPPEVISAIGRDLLKGLFRAAESPVPGDHQSIRRGTAGDPAELTSQWEPGRPIDLNLVATISNAVRRGGVIAPGRLRLSPDDFAVVERSAATSVSTILAIDRSRSMGQSGAWTAARKVGLAMHELIRRSYPRDSLGILAFSSTAEAVHVDDIPELQWDRFEHGTHLQAALEFGRTMLRRKREGTKQIVVITDGEPTLARIGGEEVFASPPTAAVVNATMTEVVRCTREGITINIVMLGVSGRNTFAEQVARVNRGRVFEATNESLGAYILRDYISR